MRETDKERGSWSGVIICKDFDLMIKLCLQKEVEKQYAQEIQSFYRTPFFRIAIKSISSILSSEEIDHRPLENIIKEAQEKAPLLNSKIMAIGPSSQRTSSTSGTAYSRLIGMKIVAVLVIFCCSTHQNKSNSIPLLIAMYIYSAKVRVNTITFFNHFGFSVSYDVL